MYLSGIARSILRITCILLHLQISHKYVKIRSLTTTFVTQGIDNAVVFQVQRSPRASRFRARARGKKARA